MGRSIIISLLIACVLFTHAQQDIKDYTLQNITAVKTNDPDSNDYSDLDAIGKAIGNARIVMVGEQDHGDAPSFLAKTRIIKYLHQKMGFDVLVFESDFWALSRVWSNMNTPGFNGDSIRDNTYSIWSHCVQVQPLYKYINTCSHDTNPIIVAGMDCKHTGPYSKIYYLTQFDSTVLQKSIYYNRPVILNHFRSVLGELINRDYQSRANKVDQHFFLSVLDTLMIRGHLDIFWKQELVNLKACAISAWRAGHGFKRLKNPLRDIQMADNLNWLYHSKYAGKKIIVWAHNIHVSRNTTYGKRKIYFYNQTTGNEIYGRLNDMVYTIGFTSYSGRTARVTTNKPYDIQAPQGGCFENWMHSKGMDFGFINFRNYTGHTAFKMAGLQHWDLKADWTHIFDGMFYVRDMYPCDRTQ